MKPYEIVERVMTQHWDMAACRCWVCVEGRAHGCRPREPYLPSHGRMPRVTVEPSAPIWPTGRHGMSAKRFVVYIDGDEPEPSWAYDAWELDCPNIDAHERHPLGYMAWHEWAKAKGKTHRQRKCWGCGRLAIWYAKTPSGPPGTEDAK